MGGLCYVYLKKEDTLILRNLEPGETEIRIPGKTLKATLRKTRNGFKLLLSTPRGVAKIKTLIIENTGPGVLSITRVLPERIESFRLSWDGRSLKIIGLRLSEKPVELNLILVPMDLSSFNPSQ
ncbi:MAG: hypothetical protein QW506_06960 [Thermoproteota archaeon]